VLLPSLTEHDFCPVELLETVLDPVDPVDAVEVVETVLVPLF
jgi:hypothetical protein